MVAVGEKLELAITDLGHEGQGVGRHEGQVVFVPGALPGDTVQVRLLAAARRHLVGQLQRVVAPSGDRRRSPCILADNCGGCSLQPLEDAAEAAWKQRSLEQTLQRIGGLSAPVRPLLAATPTLGYRNRALIPLERTGEGRLRAGYYRRGSHRIVNMARCPVLDPRIDCLIAPLKADLEASDWPVDRHGGAGETDQGPGLRHLGLRVGVATGELLITLISSHDDLPGLAELADAWRERWPDLVGVCLNLQPLPSNRLMGEETRLIRGREWINETFAGLRFRIAADTFFQVNTRQAERLVACLKEALGPGPGGGSLLDAYAGIGTYSLPLAAAGWQVHGLELHPSAVAMARLNAAANQLEERARFEQADVPLVLEERLQGMDALVLDPPRKGLAPAATAAILANPPARIAYISCDPASLARDLAQLCGTGAYRLNWVQPVDFFPNTSHVEALAALQRT
ncbi:23S rRNA (uracil(1939)-C(5))-methyltransferase RlmD [Synechococcus sp. CCY 9618]|uniref:23S rRNA (uracil(1939)-C(5))-methyltransferase RlmD n=1 Tax=Synechococcus sp. CCY 9618 TaxID=2815602 RepID=UPI001C21377E|nr:23S rRNA (uracil(1939)-C(5))-methyltransferase RlmD [Synechococcus sp. CCY 9618]